MRTDMTDDEFEFYVEEPEGSCDAPKCGVVYDVSSREDHCPECGTCWEHCPNDHTPESILALDRMLLMEDDFEIDPDEEKK